MKSKNENKMKKEKVAETTSRSIPVLTILLVLFLVSKIFQIGLCKDWSWWWIFSPVWIPLAILALIAAGILIVLVVVKVLILIFER